MLMLVSLLNGRLNQITFLFLFLPHLFEWLLLVSPTLMNLWVLLPLCLPIVTFCPWELEFTGFMYSNLLWNPLFWGLHHISFTFPHMKTWLDQRENNQTQKENTAKIHICSLSLSLYIYIYIYIAYNVYLRSIFSLWSNQIFIWIIWLLDGMNLKGMYLFQAL